MNTPANHSLSVSRFIDSSKRGFSLVELLTCIAILGIMAAMAIPCLAGMADSSASAKTKRQAQTIAQTYASACAAGAVFTEVTPEAVVDALTQVGGVRGKGIFSDMAFSVFMSAEEKTSLCASGLLAVKSFPDGSALLAYK